MPSLLVMVDRYPGLFCPGQVWYRDEAFMATAFDGPAPPPPTRVIRVAYALPRNLVGVYGKDLSSAVTLAASYLESPHHEAWRGYLWTSDFDAIGQQVFVGGTENGRGFEIHRHIKPDERFGIALWE